MRILFELFIVSALLFAGYAWLLERRADFRWCRGYLALLPLLSVLIPLLEIPLWPAKTVVLTPLSALPEAEATIVTSPVAERFDWAALLWGIYALGVLLLLMLMLYQVVKIRLLERGAAISQSEGIRIVRTTSSIASFSFFGSVYLPATTPAEEVAVILKHEGSHIRHRHSLERLWMEFCKALLWWNPFIWLAARRLTEVEEFEADRDVLLSGEDTNHYIQTIFKQLFGYSPDIANGLRDSLTKKRFNMMTQNNKSRYARLCNVTMLSLVTALVVSFGTTARATQFIEMPQESDQRLKVEKMPLFEGGDLTNFRQWVMMQVSYPQEAQERGISGRVIASFEVDAAGKVANIQILQSPDQSLSTEVKRVLERSPRWEPGYEKGSPVSVKFTIPVDFTVMYDGDEPSKGSTPLPEMGPNTIKEVKVVTFGEKAPEPKQPETVLSMAGKMPVFQGGALPEFQRWVAENLKYPQEAIKQKISGRVVVQFVINEEGAVVETKALTSPHQLLSSEAIRVVNSSPRWEPAEHEGRKVSVRFVLPVDFAL